MIALDTQIVVDALLNRLRPAEAKLMDDDAWAIADIVVWEISWLARERRVPLDVHHPRFRRFLDVVQVYAIDHSVALALQRLDFRADPADEIIAATSLAHDVPLLTRDMRILGSRVVPLALR